MEEGVRSGFIQVTFTLGATPIAPGYLPAQSRWLIMHE